ncbi:MAG: enoyl-CoA hydratase/isomerase family protein [Gemmatimonadetes bacterium]|nr:enoyl-CoA hydratase/isomerase family protein [Gemmatimonadota bacterium]
MTEIALRTTVADGIARVMLDHPPLNVLTRDVLAELRQALRSLAERRDLRVLILGASGKHFSAGADVAEHMPPVFRDLIPEFLETVLAVVDFPLPVIAAVQGRCLGGGFELISAADIILASEDAIFGHPEIKLGVFPPAACVLLPVRCHWGVAAELLYSGEPIAAAHAREAGLARDVVPLDRLDATVAALAERIARHSAVALRLTKRCLRETWLIQREMLWRAGRIYSEDLMATEDAVVGLAAFLEKRQPVWRHE